MTAVRGTGKRRTNVILRPNAHPAPEVWLIFHVPAFPYKHILRHSFPFTLAIAKNFHLHGDDGINAGWNKSNT